MRTTPITLTLQRRSGISWGVDCRQSLFSWPVIYFLDPQKAARFRDAVDKALSTLKRDADLSRLHIMSLREWVPPSTTQPIPEYRYTLCNAITHGVCALLILVCEILLIILLLWIIKFTKLRFIPAAQRLTQHIVECIIQRVNQYQHM